MVGYFRTREMNRDIKIQGQSLVEFVLAISVCSVLFTGIGLFLWMEWKQVGCLYFAFESTHRRLIGVQTPYSHPKYRIRFEVQNGRANKLTTPLAANLTGESGGFDVPQGILKGLASCGKISEEVRLPYLESAQW